MILIISEAILWISEAIPLRSEAIVWISLDTSGVHDVNSSHCTLILMKGAHCMSMYSLTILVFTSPDAGMLRFRGAPVDRC